MGGGFPAGNRSMDSGSRRLGDGQEIGGNQGRPADQPAIDVGLREQLGRVVGLHAAAIQQRSEEHTSELQSLMRISYAVFCLKKKNTSLNSKSKQQNHQ